MGTIRPVIIARVGTGLSGPPTPGRRPSAEPKATVRRLSPAIVFAVACAIALAGAAGVYAMRRRNFEVAIDAMLIQAQAKLQAGERAEAEQLLATYVPLRPGDRAAKRQHAELLLERITTTTARRRDKVRASAALEAVLRENPDDAQLRLQLAKTQLSIPHYPSALENLRFLRQKADVSDTTPPESGPPSATARSPELDAWTIDVLIADALAGSGQFREAIDTLGTLVNFDAATRTFLDPRTSSPASASADGPKRTARDTTEAYLKLASLLQDETSDMEAAGRVLERAAQENPGNAQIWLRLAVLRWNHLKDEAGGRDAVDRATALAPDDSMVLYVHFYRCMTEKQHARAATYAARARELHPEADWVYAAEAKLATHDGDTTRAINALADGIVKLGAQPVIMQQLVDMPDTPEMTRELATRIGHLREKLPADDAFLAVLEARLLISSGKSLAAKRILEKVRPLVAHYRALLASIDIALGRCHQRLGEPDLQLAACERALSLDSDSAEALAGIATAMLDCGQTEAALTKMRDAAKRLSRDELAAMPQIWRPLVRLESEALRRLPAGKADWSALESRVRAIEDSPVLGRDNTALLRAEVLAGRGEIDESLAVLDEAAAATPSATAVQAARIAARATAGGADVVRGVIEELPTDIRDDPAILRAEADAAVTFSQDAGAGLLADIEDRGCNLPSDDDAMAILDQLVSLAISDGRLADADRIARRMIERCPDAPRGAIALCVAGLARSDADAVRESAALLAKTLGDSSMETKYATAASRLLDERDAADGPPRPGKDKLRDIRNSLTEIELRRPQWPNVLLLEAELDLLEENTSAAIDHYSKAAAMRPRNPAIARALIALLLRSRQFTDAERALAGLDQAGLDRLARYAAELKMRAGRTDEAVAIALRAVATPPHDADDLVWFAEILRDHGHGTEAEQALALATQHAPERVAPWLELLDQEAACHEADRIKATLARALASVPEEHRQLLQAEGDRLLGSSDAAAAGFRRAIATANGDATVIRYAANGLLLNGQRDEARAALDTLVSLKATSDSERQARAWARRTLVTMTTSGATYATLVRGLDMLKKNAGTAWPDSPEDAILAVSLLAARPEPQCWRRAVDILDMLDERQLLTVDQRVLRATLRDKIGSWEKCRPELLDLAMKPDMPSTVYATLVTLLIEHGDPEAAEPWLQKLVSIAPDAAETIALQSRLLLTRGDRPAAVQEARRLMPAQDAAVGVRSLLDRARLLEELGFRKAADMLLRRAAEESIEGTIARAAGLARWGLADESLEVIESAWDAVPLDVSLGLVASLVATEGAALRGSTAERVAGLVERARAADPDSVELALLQSELRMASGDSEDAAALLRSLLDREGLAVRQKARAVAALTACLAGGPITAEANDVIESAIREVGPLPELLDARGVARITRGENAKATADFREACLAPTPRRLLHLAFALCEAGDHDGARAAFARASEHPLFEDALIEPDRRWFESVQEKLGMEQSH